MRCGASIIARRRSSSAWNAKPGMGFPLPALQTDSRRDAQRFCQRRPQKWPLVLSVSFKQSSTGDFPTTKKRNVPNNCGFLFAVPLNQTKLRQETTTKTKQPTGHGQGVNICEWLWLEAPCQYLNRGLPRIAVAMTEICFGVWSLKGKPPNKKAGNAPMKVRDIRSVAARGVSQHPPSFHFFARDYPSLWHANKTKRPWIPDLQLLPKQKDQACIPDTVSLPLLKSRHARDMRVTRG